MYCICVYICINPERRLFYLDNEHIESFVLNQSRVGGLQAAAQWAVMDYKLLIWCSFPLKGIEKRLRCPGCVASLQHQPVSACWEESSSGGREWVDIKRWNAASAAKLHATEHDFVSVARSNALYSCIFNIRCCPCVSEQKYVLIKEKRISAVFAVLLEWWVCQLTPVFLLSVNICFIPCQCLH